MNKQYDINEIRQLEYELSKNPYDTDLMNKLAIGYLSCSDANGYSKVDDLFEKAYKIKPSIKTANNYAYQIITDWFGYEEGIKILQPFINKEPKSFMPYNLIAYAYLMSKDYAKAKFYYEKAMTLSQTELVEINHNLAVCENQLNNHQNALTLYEKSITIKDKENLSKYNKALTHIELNQTSEIDQIVREIKKSEAYKSPSATVSNIDLAQLYYINRNFKKAYELLIENPNIYLQAFPELSYLLLKFNKSKFDEIANEEIENIKSMIVDLNNPTDEEYNDYSEQERIAEIKKLHNEIETIKTLKQKLINPPDLKPSKLYQTMFLDCLFYDCKIHGTQFDD